MWRADTTSPNTVALLVGWSNAFKMRPKYGVHVTARIAAVSRSRIKITWMRTRRRRRYDVVFYTPWIGSILGAGESLPPGGAETQILLLSRELVTKGLRVAIIAFGTSAELPSDVDGVTVVPRQAYVKRDRIVGKLAEAFQVWRALWRAPSHAVVYRAAGIELGLIAVYTRLARRRLVYSSANVVDFEFAKLRPKRRDLWLYELGVRLANAIVVQTEEQIELCRTKFGRQPHLIKSLAPLAELQHETPDAFLWVGRLVSYKRPLEYVALARALPEARFWMVGVPTPHHDDDRLVIEAVMAAGEEVANLDLLPPRPHTEIEELMLRAVASVNTADFEGMPNVLLEAWSRGVPALVLRHDPGGVVSAHQLGGFAEGSAERLVVLANEQWESRHDRSALAKRCRRYIVEHHAPEAVAERWLGVLSLSREADGVPRSAREVEFVCAE